MSLTTHTEALSAYLLANIPDLKDVYSKVTLGMNKGKEWPVYWCDGWNDGKPVLSDFRRNYVYFRQVGETDTEETDISSCLTSYYVKYPMRAVIHYRNRGEDKTREYLYAYQQMLLSYKFEDKNTRIELEDSEYDPKVIFENETNGAEFKIDRDSMLISIDFRIVEMQTPGQCLPDIFCGSDGTAELIYPYQS